MKHALIIFVKNLVLGSVKTRVAAKLGDEEALNVYRYLLKHTQQITKPVQADRHVFYSGFVEEQGWSVSYAPYVQQGSDLGQRIANAFEQVFAWGFEKVVIIGSDCLELDTTLIEQAFTELEKSDVVIGPAKDGGYYLLGLKQQAPALFENIAWSTNTVFSQTIATCRQLALTVTRLPVLGDIDEAEDWIRAKDVLYE